MDKVLTVNEMLRLSITKLDSNLLPPHINEMSGPGSSVRAIVYQSLCNIIDHLGKESARAQKLNRVITSADKMRNSDHTLYLLKDCKANGGKGEVLGYLKIGTKKLYLHDELERVVERDVLCVLDFFVLESHRRLGYGQLLFDNMLRDQEVKVHDLAIDGPSPKMEQFLRKNYGVDKLLRQRNNFAVSSDFFHRNSDSPEVPATPNTSKSDRSTPQTVGSFGRFAAPRPPCAIASIIHGDSNHDNEKKNENDDWQPEESWSRPTSPQPGVSRPSSLDVNAHVVASKLSELDGNPPAHVNPSQSAIASTSNTPNQSRAHSPTHSRSHSPGYTAQGHMDLKFFHNKLW